MTDEPSYRVRRGKVGPDEDMPAGLNPSVFYLGAAVAGAEFEPGEWQLADLPGEAHPCTVLLMKLGAMGNAEIAVEFPPVLFTVSGAALMIGSLLTSFDGMGMGPRLQAELDQVKAGWRDAPTEDLL